MRKSNCMCELVSFVDVCVYLACTGEGILWCELRMLSFHDLPSRFSFYFCSFLKTYPVPDSNECSSILLFFSLSILFVNMQPKVCVSHDFFLPPTHVSLQPVFVGVLRIVSLFFIKNINFSYIYNCFVN